MTFLLGPFQYEDIGWIIFICLFVIVVVIKSRINERRKNKLTYKNMFIDYNKMLDQIQEAVDLDAMRHISLILGWFTSWYTVLDKEVTDELVAEITKVLKEKRTSMLRSLKYETGPETNNFKTTE